VALCDEQTIRAFVFAPKVSGASQEPATTLDVSCVSIPIGTTAHEATKRLVRATIQQCAGNRLQAARMLGIPPRTMYRHFSDPRQ
jgi:DNA-binding NtrC family response regulator